MSNESEKLGSFYRWKPSAWLKISGEDAFSFLQGQFTNDLRNIEKSGSIYGLWLNHKGKVLADSFVGAAGAGSFWVGSYFSSADCIRERLESFVIADDVVIEDITATREAITLVGSATPALAPEAAEKVVSFLGRRAGDPTTEWVFSAEHAESVHACLRGRDELPAAAMELLRIRNGIAAVPRDIGPGELPNEGGLDRDAVSYTKGCYLGQEVMARLKSMGQVRRKLMRVTGEGPLPPLPAPLYQGERKVGDLRTGVQQGSRFMGLGLVTMLQLRLGEGLALSQGGENCLRLESVDD